MLASVLALALAAAAPAAEGQSLLQKAERDLSALHWSKAEQELTQARAARGNDQRTNLRSLELLGVVEAALGKKAKALEAFEQLLLLAPDRQLSEDYGPKISTVFFEAKAWLDDHHPLQLEALPAETAPGQVKALVARVQADPLLGAKSMRFHLGSGEVVAPVADGRARAELSGVSEVSYWAELLGQNDEVLGQLADPAKPLQVRAPPAPPAPPPPALTAAPEVKPAPQPAGALTTAAPEAQPRYRPLAYGLMGGGAAMLATGAFFGLQSRSARSQIQDAQVDSQGRVTGLTQVQASDLDSKARTDAAVADVLLATGAVAAGAGVAVWFLGQSVAVAPTGNGAVVQGEIP